MKDQPEAERPDSPKMRGLRLKQIRNLGNLTRKELSEYSDVNLHTLSGWENGRFGGLSTMGAERIIDYLNAHGVSCSFEWLMYNKGAGPIGVLGCANQSADTVEQSHRINHPQLMSQELRCFQMLHKNTTEFVLSDDSMAPTYQPGELVAGIKRYGTAIATLIGQDCIIELENQQKIVRTLKKGEQTNRYLLACNNIKYKADNAILCNIQIISAAPIIWHRKKDLH